MALLSAALTPVACEVALRVCRCKPTLQSGFYLTSDWYVRDRETIMIKPCFRQDDYYATPQAAKIVVTLGDSFCEGFAVPAEESFPAVLRTLLAGNNPSVRILNLGQGNTGPDQQLKIFTHYALPRVKPDIVIWTIYPNDILDNVDKAIYTLSSEGRLVPLNGASSWLERRQLLFENFPLPRSIKGESYLFGFCMKATERWARCQVPPAYRNDPYQWGLKKVGASLAEMDRLAEDKGFRAYYVLIAPQSVYLWDAHRPGSGEPGRKNPRLDHSRLETVMRERRGYIDARFANPYSSPPASPEIFADESVDKSSLGNRHFNRLGNRLLAEKVATRLQRDGLDDATK